MTLRLALTAAVAASAVISASAAPQTQTLQGASLRLEDLVSADVTINVVPGTQGVQVTLDGRDEAVARTTMATEGQDAVIRMAPRNVEGTLCAGRGPRIVGIEHVPVEAALVPDMLFIRNEDKPGMIGGLGTVLAQAGQNIADFRLGRVAAGDKALALVALDAPLPDPVFVQIEKLPQVRTAKRLHFS